MYRHVLPKLLASRNRTLANEEKERGRSQQAADDSIWLVDKIYHNAVFKSSEWKNR